MDHMSICKAWAKGSTKTLKGYAIFTNGGGRIYSWGHHYIMGQTYKGDTIALINSTGYSSSTAKHTSYTVTAAVRAGLRIFMVPHPEEANHPLNYLHLEDRIKEAKDKGKRARKYKDLYAREEERAVKDYADFKELFPIGKE